jgi:acyl carrier protein
MAYRRSLGLPGLSIAWGLWHPAELSPAKAATVIEGFATIGVRSFTAELGLAAQAHLLQTEASQITVADVDWARLQIFYTLTKPRRFLAEVARVTSGQPSYGAVEPGEVATPLTLRQKLEAAPAAERSALLLQHLRLELGKILGISPETIDLEQGLMDMGLDSLMAVEVRNRLSKSLQQRLPATLIFDYPTLHKLAAYLQSSLGLQWTNSTTAPAESTTAPVKKAVVAEPAVGTTTDLDTLSDEEAADLLTAKLAEMGLTS